MQITSENIIWIIVGIVAAALVAYGLVSWIQSAVQRADAAVFDIEAYSDGVVYFTIKNTGTVPITAVSIDGTSATGTLPLEGGQEAQYQASGLTLTSGDMHTFTIEVTFSNGQTKTIRRKAIVQEA